LALLSKFRIRIAYVFFAFSVAVILGNLFQLWATAGLRHWAAAGQGAAGKTPNSSLASKLHYITVTDYSSTQGYFQ